MPRFSLSQLLMGTALVAIGLLFYQSEGCGHRYTMIESVSFWSDDSRIAVSKLNSRDANNPRNVHIADVSRTLSWINASNGITDGIVHQDFRPGNCGHGVYLWCVGRTSATCDPSTDRFAMTDFGGGDVIRVVGDPNPNVISVKHQGNHLTFSKSGRFFAVNGTEDVTVFDSLDHNVALHVETDAMPFFHTALSAFTADETRLVVAEQSRRQCLER